MKTVKCPDCKREREINDDVIITLCKCGWGIEINNGDRNGKG